MPPATRAGGIEVLPTGAGGLAALLACDVVIKSPGISRYRPEVEQLEQAGVAVRSGLGLWLEDVPLEHVVCITGSKGKSTTSAIAGHLLTKLGYRAAVGGNIGRPPWEPSAEPAPDYWVIETSSYQVPDLTNGPPVVAVTSLSPDHLDWHGSVDRYYADKLSLCTKPGVRLAIADGSNATLREHAASLGPHVEWVDADDREFAGPWVAALGLPGVHNVRNAAIARAVLLALGVTEAGDEAKMTAAAEGFAGLPSRCRSLGHIGPVEFVDDSLSTNVLPAQAALAGVRGPSGRPPRRRARSRPRLLGPRPDHRRPPACRRWWSPCPTTGRASDGPSATWRATGSTLWTRPGWTKRSPLACAWAHEGGVVLLSPAAPSFGRFADYRDRAGAFAAAVRNCGTLT